MDEYGNLLGEQKVYANPWAPTGMSVAVDATTNRLSGRPHDALGNLTQVEGPDGATLTLDYLDQGHVARVTGGSVGEYRYYYDADGKRRIKAKGPQAACTGYSLSFYEGEDLVCQVDAGDAVQPDAAYRSKYLLTDHLGTTRAELTVDAADTPLITQTYDTMPYGELLDPPDSPMESVLFTGKQRDAETGLDVFKARYYSNNLGRWPSPDKLFADNQHERPQSWNLYSYCRNNPINFIDSLGEASFHAQDQSTKNSVNNLYAKNPMFRALVGYIATHNPQDAVIFRNMGGKKAPAGAYASMYPQQIKDSKGNVIRTNYIVDLYSVDSNGKPIGIAATKDSQTIHETAHISEKMAGYDLKTLASSGADPGTPENPIGAREYPDSNGGPSSYCSSFARVADDTPDSKPKQSPVDIFSPGFAPVVYNTTEDIKAQQDMQNVGIK